MKTLKELQTLKSKISNKLKVHKNEISILLKEVNMLNQELANIDIEINKLSNNKVIISEHAILRYLERVINIDMDQIKKEIMSDEVQQKALVLGDCTYPYKNFKLKIKNNVVITILTNN